MCRSFPWVLLKNITQNRWESRVAKHHISNKPLGDAAAGVWTMLESSIWAGRVPGGAMSHQLVAAAVHVVLMRGTDN